MDHTERAPAKLLYHYTDARALSSIVRNAPTMLWASEALFLNDSEELVAAREPVKQHMERAIRSLETHPDYGVYENGMPAEAQAMRNAIELLDNLGQSKSDDDRVFVACFCEDGDLLSQWRSYGQGGYAIGFDKETLGASKPADFTLNYHDDAYLALCPQVKLRRVVYNHDPAAIDAMMQAAIADIAPPGLGLERGFIYQVARWQTLMACAQIKDSGFKEEQEWRLIYVRRGDSVGHPLASPIDIRPATHFRPSRGLLVPYIPLEIDSGAVKQVIVGPGGNQDLRVMTVKRLAEELGRTDIEVLPSKLPYRADSSG